MEYKTLRFETTEYGSTKIIAQGYKNYWRAYNEAYKESIENNCKVYIRFQFTNMAVFDNGKYETL